MRRASPGVRGPARGAVGLALCLVLLSLGLASAVLGWRHVQNDQQSAQALAEQQRARLGAEWLLAWGMAQWPQDPAALQAWWDQGRSSDCPAGLDRTRLWQCRRLTAPYDGPDTVVGAQAAWRVWRDLSRAPHVLQTEAVVVHSGGARSQLQQQWWVPSLGRAGSAPAAQGWVTGGCAQGQAGQAWRQVMGQIQASQLQALSQAQAAASGQLVGARGRSVYWVDAAADWRTPLGSPTEPVLLVFSEAACASRCPRLLAPLVGTVIWRHACGQGLGDTPLLQAPVLGQAVIEASSVHEADRVWVIGHTNADQAYRLARPEGMDLALPLPVAGSWREGSP
ncbi:MAG: hypothetical protein RIQ97_2270 [Pseudomonadota bacterium]